MVPELHPSSFVVDIFTDCGRRPCSTSFDILLAGNPLPGIVRVFLASHLLFKILTRVSGAHRREELSGSYFRYRQSHNYGRVLEADCDAVLVTQPWPVFCRAVSVLLAAHRAACSGCLRPMHGDPQDLVVVWLRRHPTAGMPIEEWYHASLLRPSRMGHSRSTELACARLEELRRVLGRQPFLFCSTAQPH